MAWIFALLAWMEEGFWELCFPYQNGPKEALLPLVVGLHHHLHFQGILLVYCWRYIGLGYTGSPFQTIPSHWIGPAPVLGRTELLLTGIFCIVYDPVAKRFKRLAFGFLFYGQILILRVGETGK